MSILMIKKVGLLHLQSLMGMSEKLHIQKEIEKYTKQILMVIIINIHITMMEHILLELN